MSDVQLTSVRDAHRFDETRLQEYLSQHIDGFTGPLLVQQFEGGQSNPTFHLTAGNKRYVMRKKPPGQLLKSAHQVDREYRIMAALKDTAVPVPKMHHLCMDDGILGTAFYIMEAVEGRVFINPQVPSFSADERHALYSHFITVLADLHKVDHAAVGLSDFGRPGNYFARQISRWSKQYIASKTDDIPEMDALMDWLPANIPDGDETTIVHGDFRIGNCILHPTEPHIVAVLDWELSTLGHPLADVAYCCANYHSGSDHTESFAGVDFAATGIPTEEEFIHLYCARTGRTEIPNWRFYITFNLFRSASIIQGVYKRGLDGISSSDRSLTYAALPRKRAEWAWALVDRA